MNQDAEATRRCYICNVFFEDRVKLGVHLLRCYHEAVHVRGELWHPHPSDLMDRQEAYTAYMRKNVQQERQDQYRDLQRRNIPVASADDFAAIRGAVNAPHSGGAPRQSGQSALRGGHQGASPNQVHPSHISGAGGAQTPLRSVVPGSDARPVSPAKDHHHDGGYGQPAPVSPTRQHKHSTCPNQVPSGHISGANLMEPPLRSVVPGSDARPVSPAKHHHHDDGYRQPAPVSPTRQHYAPPPIQHQPHHAKKTKSALDLTQDFGQALDALNGSKVDRRSKAVAVADFPGPPIENYNSGRGGRDESPHGALVSCVKCGKQFGKKGYQIHVQRCGRDAQEDFTFSRDARRLHPRTSSNGIVNNQNPEEDPQHEKNWVQFMVTYPKPVLDEQPMTKGQRDRLAAEQKSRREMQAEMDRVNALHPPCGPSALPPLRGGGSPSRGVGLGNAAAAPVPETTGRGASPQRREDVDVVQCKNCGLNFNQGTVQKHMTTCTAQPRPF